MKLFTTQIPAINSTTSTRQASHKNTASKKERPRKSTASVTSHTDTLLRTVSQRNHDVEQLLLVLGWSQVPNQVIIEILDDLIGFSEELKGGFSTLCPYVQNRRKRVFYWIESLQNGICSAETAAQALHIPSLSSRG